MSNHIAQFELMTEVLVSALRLPEDTEVVRCWVDQSQPDRLVLVVSHKDLRPIEAGDDIPMCCPMLQRECTPTESAMGGEGRVSFAGWGQ